MCLVHPERRQRTCHHPDGESDTLSLLQTGSTRAGKVKCASTHHTGKPGIHLQAEEKIKTTKNGGSREKWTTGGNRGVEVVVGSNP